MAERLQRLVMHAFRGVPGEMAVDFGSGQSIAVYGDNGTGKSTIADALEWYFTGEIELLPTRGASTPSATWGAKATVTSVEVVTDGVARRQGWSSRTSARRRRFAATGRETFLLRGRTLADFINKTKTEKWKALVEILRPGRHREPARGPAARAQRPAQAGQGGRGAGRTRVRRALASGDEAVTRRDRAARASSRSARCSAWSRPTRSTQVVDPGMDHGRASAPARPAPSRRSARALLAEIKALSTPAARQEARCEAWNALVVSEAGAGLPRGVADPGGEAAARDADRSTDAARSAARRWTRRTLARENRERAGRHDGSLAGAGEGPRCDRSAGRRPRARPHDRRRALHARARRSRRSSCHRSRRFRARAARQPRRARAASTSKALADVPGRGSGSGTRAPGSSRRRQRRPKPGTRDSQLVMLAAICQQIKSWRAAEKTAARGARAPRPGRARLRRLSGRSRRRIWPALLTQISRRVAQIYCGAPPGRGPRGGQHRAVDGQGRRAGHRLPRLAPAPAARRAQRVAPELAGHRALPGHGGDLQRAARLPGARRRDQQLRPRAPRPSSPSSWPTGSPTGSSWSSPTTTSSSST